MDYQYELDARGLKAPIPVLRLKRAMAQMKPGEVLRLKRAMAQMKPGEVLCLIVDDAHCRPDVQAFAHHARQKLVAQDINAGESRYYLEKS